MRRRPWHASSNAPPNLRALLFFGFFVSACCPLAPPVSSPSFKIRAARVSDAEAIAELLTAVFEAPLLKWYELPERQARRGFAPLRLSSCTCQSAGCALGGWLVLGG